MLWIELSNTQDNDGNVRVRESKLMAIVTQLYTKGYPGGLLKYIDDIQDAYAGLDVLGNVYGPHQKLRQLLNNLSASGVND